jgi:hypothetical protein
MTMAALLSTTIFRSTRTPLTCPACKNSSRVRSILRNSLAVGHPGQSGWRPMTRGAVVWDDSKGSSEISRRNRRTMFKLGRRYAKADCYSTPSPVTEALRGSVLCSWRASIYAHTQGPLLPPADCTNVRLEATLHVYRAPDICRSSRLITATPPRMPAPCILTARPVLSSRYSHSVPAKPLTLLFRWSTEFSTPDIPCREVPFRTINANRPPNGIERNRCVVERGSL